VTDTSTPQFAPTRRTFLSTAGLAGLALGAGPVLGATNPPSSDDPSGAGGDGAGGRLPAHFPHQDPDLVRRVVGASHGDLDTVRELVGARPELAKAVWDWGFGDWESALGAAAHTGSREIAELLIAHGARPTLFSAAMLGQLAVVRSFVEASPGIQATPGPHGISLLAHARFGGEAAAPVLAYLEEVGGADAPEAVPLPDGASALYLGTYKARGGELFDVTESRFGLMVGQQGGVARGLVHLGNHTFHPGGAPSVRVRFEGADSGEPAGAFTIRDAELLVRAERVAEGLS
jgi:hypothetical protein